jgi:hypothetical protein
MRILKSGLLYFALVFAIGFMLGPVRIFWIAPRVGARTAELLEAPVMLLVSVVVARWIVRRLGVSSKLSSRLRMAALALGLMLLAEFTLVLSLRGVSIRQYLAERDPVAGVVYYVTLGVFALMPLLVARRSAGVS